MSEKLQSLYNNLIKEGYALPEYNVFKVDMSNPVKSKKLHDNLVSEEYDIPDYDTFLGDMGLKKKDISGGAGVSATLAPPYGEEQPQLPLEKIEEKQPTIEEFIANAKPIRNPFIQEAVSTKVRLDLKPLQLPTLGEFLNEHNIKPEQVGYSKDINLNRTLREGEEEELNIILKRKGLDTKPKTSYFWGTMKEQGLMPASLLRDLDDMVKMVASGPGIKESPIGIFAKPLAEKRTSMGILTHTGVFRTAANWMEGQVKDVPGLPQDDIGKLVGGVVGLEPLFLEMWATPAVKLSTIAGKSITLPRFLNQMVAKGFTGAYAREQGTIGSDQNKAIVEGLKGGGLGGAQALAFIALGYGTGKLGVAVTEATKSGALGVSTNIVGNAFGFGEFTALTGGNEEEIREARILGGVLALPSIANFALNRAMGNYLTASPAAKQAAENIRLSPTEMRDKTYDLREQASAETDPNKREAQEITADVLDNLTDVKVIKDEVSKAPMPLVNAINESDLPKEQQDIIKQNIFEDAKQNIPNEKWKAQKEIDDIQEQIKVINDNEAIPEEQRKLDIAPLKEKLKIKQEEFANIKVKPKEEKVAEPKVEEVAEPAKITVEPVQKTEVTSIYVAPWESKKVEDFNDESGFDEIQYKEFQDALPKIAESMGYPIEKINRTIGGWFSGKKKIHEPSVGIVIPTQNQEDIDLFSSLAGTLAPQTQNSVIRIKVKRGEVGDWTEITPKDIESVNKITDKLKKLGFSLEKDNNKLYIGTQNIDELNNLYEILEENGTGITKIRTRQASVDFFDKGNYLPTLEKYGDRSHRRYGGVGGENLYNYVTQATNRLRGEQIPVEPIAEPVKPLSPIEPTPPPPTKENVPEVPQQGEETKIRKIGQRALDAVNLKDDVKEEIKRLGIEYVPRGEKFTESEAESIVNLFDSVEEGLDKIAAEVYNTTNGILPDTRTILNAILIEKYSTKLEGITDPVQREIGRSKLSQSIIFAAEQGTLGGQQVEANKRIARVLMSTPETIVATVREKLDRENKEYFADKITETEFAKKLMAEYVQSEDFKKKLETGVAEEIGKIGTKNWGKESKKKIDDFFNGLLIDPKRQNLYGGLLGIPVAMYNGSILAIKNALLLGVDLATAIQRGVEYLDKEFKDKYAKGIIDSPEWSRDEYMTDTKERLNPLFKEVEKPKVQKPKEAKAKKVKLPPSQEDIVNKLFEKMAKIATRKQLNNFVMKYLQEITDKGVVNDARFRTILAQALGRDYITEQTEANLTNAAKSIGWANKKTEELAKAFDDYLKEFETNPKSEKLTDLKQTIKDTKKQATKAQFAAQKANQRIREILSEEPDFVARMGTLIQGGLLIPSSQLANFFGNLLMLPVSAPAYLVSGMYDSLMSSMIKGFEPLKKIDPIKNPILYRWANSLPSSERTILPFAYLKGYIEGVPKYTWWGMKQLITGSVSRDLMKADVQRGVNPIKSAQHFWNQLAGKEKREFSKMVADAVEALPAGYLAETHFRFLNLGDKPFRGGAETGRLSELFEIGWRKRLSDARKITDVEQKDARIKYLNDSKKIERQRFITNPDSQTLTEARRQGDVATFAQSTGLSRWISSMERYFAHKDNKTMSNIADNLIRLLRITNLPYVKVPINITSTAIELSTPVIPLIKAGIHIKQGNQRAVADDIGKLIISSALTSVAISLVTNGLITTLSDDKDERAAQLESGKEEGRVNLSGVRRWVRGEDPTWQEGDKTWSIKRLGIISVQLMSIAEAYKNKTKEELERIRESKGFLDWMYKIGETNIGMLPYVPKIALNQSILTGANTLVQGLLGGEAEKDRWLTSQGTVLSTILYPSTIANISQTADPERFIRETRDLSKEEGRIKQHMINIFKDKMFMGKNLPPKVTLWGEPVRRIPEGESFLYNILGITKEKKYQKYSFGTRMYELFEQISETDPENALRVFPSLPSSATKVGWDDSRMTPQQLAEYQMRVGRMRAEDTEVFLNSKEWDEMNTEDKMNTLESIYLKARKEAEAEMFSWLNYKDAQPENWKTMLDNDALPLPSMTKKVGDYKLTNEEIEQLNTTALNFYAQEVIPFLTKNSPETLKLMRDYKDEKTGKSDYVRELNKMWNYALKEAKDLLENVFTKSRNE